MIAHRRAGVNTRRGERAGPAPDALQDEDIRYDDKSVLTAPLNARAVRDARNRRNARAK